MKMREKETIAVENFLAANRDLRKELSEDIEETKNAVDERAQFVEDLLEGLGRQQHPGTERCQQCYGAGGKWLDEKRSLSGPHGILHYLNADNKHWWSCDACKGAGRMRKESLLNVSADVPIEKKKG